MEEEWASVGKKRKESAQGANDLVVTQTWTQRITTQVERAIIKLQT